MYALSWYSDSAYLCSKFTRIVKAKIDMMKLTTTTTACKGALQRLSQPSEGSTEIYHTALNSFTGSEFFSLPGSFRDDMTVVCSPVAGLTV